MYLIDTNVVSELRRQRISDPNVLTWFRRQSASHLHLSVISLMELEQGYYKLKRRDALQAAAIRTWIDESVLESFQDRILSVDVAISQTCARLHVPDPKGYGDAIIAATALIHNLTVVTRNTDDFDGTGVSLLNPWLAA
jgi:toxin FitB